MSEAVCPRCHSSFEASSARVLPGVLSELVSSPRFRAEKQLIDANANVLCPKCGLVFPSEAVRFFGILSPRGLRIFLGLFVAAFLAVVLYVLVATV